MATVGKEVANERCIRAQTRGSTRQRTGTADTYGVHENGAESEAAISLQVEYFPREAETR